MWEVLRREGEGQTPLDLLVTDKEEVCTRLAQLPCTSERGQRSIADRHIRVVTIKMSCAQVRERVVRNTLRGKREGRAKDLEC
jgi:hypothetical protein